MSRPSIDDGEKAIERAIASVVGIHSHVPNDALTAEVLGTERIGSGVLIREDGIVATIGYLVTEAERLWVSLSDGRVVAGDVAGIDQASGLALVRLLDRGTRHCVPIGSAEDVRLDQPLVMASGDGSRLHARLIAKQDFVGYWEYRLEDALFTAPAHGHWGGAALIASNGALVGIGSLHLPGATVGGQSTDLNMSVPIDLLSEVQDDLLRFGRTRRPARPWLGIYSHQVGERIVVGGVVRQSPAQVAGLRRGDALVAVAREPVSDLGTFYESVWGLGAAGVDVPMTIERNGRMLQLTVRSGDRRDYLKQPTLH